MATNRVKSKGGLDSMRLPKDCVTYLTYIYTYLVFDDRNDRDEQQVERAREENLSERIATKSRIRSARQNSNSTSAITMIFNTRMVSQEPILIPGSHHGPPRARSGSPRSFSPRVDALDSRATGDRRTQAKTGEQR
jgi:hypothetical protein